MATLITLLTDFGTADSYVGEVKGVLLSQVHGVVLADITHQVPPGDVRAAQYILSRVWQRFPQGTVHLAVVDPGDRKSTRLNSSPSQISYAVFCLKKKKNNNTVCRVRSYAALADGRRPLRRLCSGGHSCCLLTAGRPLTASCSRRCTNRAPRLLYC